ncbi:MAG: chromosomal replication initiator DnaA [Tabrizicola sp.]|nr:chromosomal replication initiator DnaA [Tabrizicola sp.]
MTGQLIFDLPTRENLTRDEFFVAPSNALALEVVEGWVDWPGRKLVLTGPEGSGKTHLAHIWAREAGAEILPAARLATLDLTAIGPAERIAVEDAAGIAADPAAEEALFHLHNIVTREGALLLTAETPPRDWGLRLADLISRLGAAAVAALDPPDEALLSAVLVKLFADRQIAVPPNLIPYLVSRMPLSIGAARGIVARLDAHALTLGRPVTRQLAADILEGG